MSFAQHSMITRCKHFLLHLPRQLPQLSAQTSPLRRAPTPQAMDASRTRALPTRNGHAANEAYNMRPDSAKGTGSRIRAETPDVSWAGKLAQHIARNLKQRALLNTGNASTSGKQKLLSDCVHRRRRFTPQPGLRRAQETRRHPTQREPTTYQGRLTLSSVKCDSGFTGVLAFPFS